MYIYMYIMYISLSTPENLDISSYAALLHTEFFTNLLAY